MLTVPQRIYVMFPEKSTAACERLLTEIRTVWKEIPVDWVEGSATVTPPGVPAGDMEMLVQNMRLTMLLDILHKPVDCVAIIFHPCEFTAAMEHYNQTRAVLPEDYHGFCLDGCHVQTPQPFHGSIRHVREIGNVSMVILSRKGIEALQTLLTPATSIPWEQRLAEAPENKWFCAVPAMVSPTCLQTAKRSFPVCLLGADAHMLRHTTPDDRKMRLRYARIACAILHALTQKSVEGVTVFDAHFTPFHKRLAEVAEENGKYYAAHSVSLRQIVPSQGMDRIRTVMLDTALHTNDWLLRRPFAFVQDAETMVPNFSRVCHTTVTSRINALAMKNAIDTRLIGFPQTLLRRQIIMPLLLNVDESRGETGTLGYQLFQHAVGFRKFEVKPKFRQLEMTDIVGEECMNAESSELICQVIRSWELGKTR